MRLLPGLAILLCLSSPSLAAQRIAFDPGGILIKYIHKYRHWASTGQHVVIDGACISACTLITGLIDPKNVCVTPRATLDFHSVTDNHDRYSFEGTRWLWSFFPKATQHLLRARGWLHYANHPDLIVVKASEFYRSCA